ncbi:hypothetical protein AMTR_s00145p00080110 [Amborella trichopoda]|uniref:Uncharacterized protein n=1 Tax=Amborella trichopoda TaxID=13333 RepID=W1PFV4_AMBTC|nr:hypothetical protein AMTR_s00145p00080110 [Amborella trichopoda]
MNCNKSVLVIRCNDVSDMNKEAEKSIVTGSWRKTMRIHGVRRETEVTSRRRRRNVFDRVGACNSEADRRKRMAGIPTARIFRKDKPRGGSSYGPRYHKDFAQFPKFKKVWRAKSGNAKVSSSYSGQMVDHLKDRPIKEARGMLVILQDAKGQNKVAGSWDLVEDLGKMSSATFTRQVPCGMVKAARIISDEDQPASMLPDPKKVGRVSVFSVFTSEVQHQSGEVGVFISEVQYQSGEGGVEAASFDKPEAELRGLILCVLKGDQKIAIKLLQWIYLNMAAHLLLFRKTAHKRLVEGALRVPQEDKEVTEDEVGYAHALNVIMAEEANEGEFMPPPLLSSDVVGAQEEGNSVVGATPLVAVVLALVGGIEPDNVVVPSSGPDFFEEHVAVMLDDMGAEMEVPLAVIYEGIKQNGMKAKKAKGSVIGSS